MGRPSAPGKGAGSAMKTAAKLGTNAGKQELKLAARQLLKAAGKEATEESIERVAKKLAKEQIAHTLASETGKFGYKTLIAGSIGVSSSGIKTSS